MSAKDLNMKRLFFLAELQVSCVLGTERQWKLIIIQLIEFYLMQREENVMNAP